MLGLGYAMAIAAARAGHQPVLGVPPTVFMAIPVTNISAFALLAGVGIALRKRRETHRRLMLLATLMLLAPEIARLPLHVIRAVGPALIFALLDLAIIACIAGDAVRHRRPHPAFAFGGAFALLAMPFALAISRTAAWHGVALWLVR